MENISIISRYRNWNVGISSNEYAKRSGNKTAATNANGLVNQIFAKAIHKYSLETVLTEEIIEQLSPPALKNNDLSKLLQLFRHHLCNSAEYSCV